MSAPVLDIVNAVDASLQETKSQDLNAQDSESKDDNAEKKNAPDSESVDRFDTGNLFCALSGCNLWDSFIESKTNTQKMYPKHLIFFSDGSVFNLFLCF